ncbi:MAG: hemolysin III family protein [Firmicutes bacterium]|nr:hemolysin III family protein [Bacillota bacterium]
MSHAPASRRDEWANSLTHGLGTLLSIAALVVMVVFAALNGTARHVVSVALFGSALVALYAMSTLYHAFRGPRVKHVFHILDHAAIFLLIAGTYTPFCLATLRGGWGWSLFGIIWGLALLGMTFKAFFGPRLRWLSVSVYVAMGWIVIIAAKPLVNALPFGGLLALFGGGFFYTIGVIFYLWKSLPHHHAIWHLFVMLGSACHVAAVMIYVIPW